MQAAFGGTPEPCATMPFVAEDEGMPKEKTNGTKDSFGARLAALRKAAGYTQAELGSELGVSQRMIAYYESPEANPPATMLAAMATALGVSVDELVGTTQPRKKMRPANSRLQRRLQQIDKLGAKEKRQILQFLDTFLEREKLKQRVGVGG